MTMDDFSKLQRPCRASQPGAFEHHQLSRIGDESSGWPSLDDADLKQLVILKLLEYGTTEDTDRLSNIVGLYQYLIERISGLERHEILMKLSQLIGKHRYLGHMGLRVILSTESDPAIRASAADSLSSLFKVNLPGLQH